MVHGHKPNGYFITADGEGHVIAGETRQCVHCQSMWNYTPGSGITRGWCFKHNGWLCGKVECNDQQAKFVADYERATGKVVTCLAFEEHNDFLANEWAKIQFGASGLQVTEAGLVIPASVEE